MVRLLCAVAAAALVVPGVAVAQHHQDNNQSSDQHNNARHDNNRSNDQHNNRHDNNRSNDQHNNTRNDTNRSNDQHRGDRQQGNRNFNDRSRQSSFGTYRVGHRPTTYRRVNVNTYRYPSGYSYRRWSVGSILPRLFLSNSYYFNDYGMLGLGAPPPGYIWVRYGPDLLLVNRYNGRIADVIHGAFY
jgi:Ni/Co efflux regulator RcnB